MDAEQTPLGELAELVASVRAFVEWHESTGSLGLPREARSPAVTDDHPVAPAAPAARAEAPRRAVVVAPTAPAPAPERVAQPLSIAIAPSERPARLALLADQVEQCTRCELHASRIRTVFARGKADAELCFVGHRPGAAEEEQAAPFIDRAGMLLDRMIEAMGYARDDVYVCSVIKCRPPLDRKPTPSELRACLPHLAQQLELVEPKVIVALGATATQVLLGTSEPIASVRGKWKLYKGRIPLMPTFDPAYVLAQPSAKREVWHDLQEAMRVLGRAPPPRSGS
jgi:DNA polymerase